MRHRFVAATLAAGVLAVLGTAPAQAAHREHSFEGGCAIHGITKLGQPLQNTTDLVPNTYSLYDATGTCTGTLDGKAVLNAPITAVGHGPCVGNCLLSKTTDPGQATFTFVNGPGRGDDVPIDVRINFVVVLTETQFDIEGAKSGTATGHGTFLTGSDLGALLSGCDAGTLQVAPFDLWLATATPLTS
ncbi:MAG: hypothetical protein ACJ77M_05210 [Thermoleophilaceae bacterium]|jgi:hypothetical protein